MSIEKNLSEALGIEYKPAGTEIVASNVHIDHVSVAPIETTDEDEDYILVRKTIRNLIEKGNDALEDAAKIAKDNESSRGFEVVATLIKTIGETSKDLYTLQKAKKELRAPEDNKKLDETHITVDKAVFVGSTAELLKSIKAANKEGPKE
jgi:hypothetical protein